MTNRFSIEQLKSVLRYDPETGLWHWLVDRTNGVKAGDIAGHKGPKGYIYLKLWAKRYFAHRAAFFYMTGEWPLDQIDHKNRIRHDNRWINLKQSDALKQAKNRKSRITKSGYSGIREYNGKYVVEVGEEYNRFYVGVYNDLGTALFVRDDARLKLSSNSFQLASDYTLGVML